ncbi:MAG: winged helix DNA-binding protein [Ignavibacteria bacterium]|nr:winged helix DNA-binding protein [Ignavibacteria bacterium]
MKQSIVNLIFQLKSVCLSKEENIREELGLSPAEFRGIITLVPDSEVNGSILSRKMGLSVSRGSRVIDKLIENGYLKYSRSSEDKRAITVSLTDKGISVQRRINQIFDECEKSIMKKMSSDEIEIFRNSLSKIGESLLGSGK